MDSDIKILRELAKRTAEVANKPIQQQRRELWSNLNSLKGDSPLIYIRAFAFDEVFDYGTLRCQDPIFRKQELAMQSILYRDTFEDDYIIEPWLTVDSTYTENAEDMWGFSTSMTEKTAHKGAAGYRPELTPENFHRMKKTPHSIDEPKTKLEFDRIEEAVGDIITVNLNRRPIMFMWQADISTDIAKIRGLEQIMWDTYDEPEFLKSVASFMSNAVLENQQQAEDAGDFSLANHENQSIAYANELKPPKANSFGVKRSELWGYCAAQEFTGFSGEMFNEFVLKYQIPIIEKYALSAYGCCEDLTGKIKYLRAIKNLRRIAVSPFADVKKCAEQICGDYVISYRPNPATAVSNGVDEDYVKKELRTHFDALKQSGCKFDITLKDVETVAGDPDAIRKWVKIVRGEIDRTFG